MTRLGPRPYQVGDAPPSASVPVSVVVLALNEKPNIGRCLASVAWADQVVVVDSGSADRTVPLAREADAEVVEQPWLGFSAQRECALRLPLIRHDWVYFVDADEWVSRQLATEIAAHLADPDCCGFEHRLRLVVDRRHTKCDGSLVGKRACVDGPVRRLGHDIVDDDRKGLAAWLHKHVRYAELKCERRGAVGSLPERLRGLRGGGSSPPLARSIFKDLISPRIPAKLPRSFSTCTSRGSTSLMACLGSASASTTRGSR
jgi:glycosyltransferase involved in cell wall biosynthesis